MPLRSLYWASFSLAKEFPRFSSRQRFTPVARSRPCGCSVRQEQPVWGELRQEVGGQNHTQKIGVWTRERMRASHWNAFSGTQSFPSTLMCWISGWRFNAWKIEVFIKKLTKQRIVSTDSSFLKAFTVCWLTSSKRYLFPIYFLVALSVVKF